jgi:hypothetical protein
MTSCGKFWDNLGPDPAFVKWSNSLAFDDLADGGDGEGWRWEK